MPVSVFVSRANARVSRTDAGPVDPFEFDCVTIDAEQRELLFEAVGVNARGNQRAEDHVTAGAREAVEIESLHK